MLSIFLKYASVVMAVVVAEKPCTFQPHCDYGHGSRDSAPAATKEICCSLCQSHPNCAAGVLSGGTCWFKTAQEVAAGCSHSNKVDFACITSNAPKPPPPPPPPPVPLPASTCDSAACQTLKLKYEKLHNDTCNSVVAKAPVLNPADQAAFMALYQNFTGGSDEGPVFAAAQKLLDDPKVQNFLSLPDSFSKGGLDAAMVLCTVLSEGTPTALAEFAVQDPKLESLISQLLSDPILMRDMLVAGGPSSSEVDKGHAGPSRYGAAMYIYSQIMKASNELEHGTVTTDSSSFWDDRSQTNILKRVALGTALEHAVSIHHKYQNVPCDEAYDWCPTPEPDVNDTYVDPVKRYLHYEQAYKSGDLDPAFEVLTSFECRHTTNSPASDEDLEWFRRTLAIYRPDHIATSYGWRYAGSVRTEVAYGDPQCLPGICDGHYAQIPAANGVCGPRAFFGRFSRLAFGLPTWGATQPGHAAMTTWSPDGWHVLLGASWPFCWWGERSGPDFYLEAQARENRADFQKVLRGSWVAVARGEAPAGSNWGRGTSGYGQGGPWSALMLYAKKLSIQKTPPPTRVVGPSIVSTKVAALLAKWSTNVPIPNITKNPKTGTITIPAAAFASKNRSASVSIMKSADDGLQIIHGGCQSSVGPPCLSPTSSSFNYDINIESTEAGTYFLTTNITTWHPNQDLMVSVNAGKAVEVPVFYTVGWWNQTQPLEVVLKAGVNTLSFFRTTVRELVFKSFILYKKKPSNIPLPPANYTPSPAPPFPPAGDYIEVPADTTCAEQGITTVPEIDCPRACLALGFKNTGVRARPNISGCFVMTTGQYAGNCNYNSNTSATCTPPCTLYGSIVRSLCIRK